MSHTHSEYSTARTILATLIILAVFSIVSAPRFSHAANYAFVNQSGEVSIVVANDPMTAIATAFNRAIRSGVILLDSTSDTGLVGDKVSGT